jgi:IclR family acetate operon transcriptional repressor
VQTVDRAASVLKLVSDADGQSLTEIAEAASLPASTVYRLLTTLQSHRMVEFDEQRQLWYVGLETFRMGASYLRRRKLAERGRALMRVLQAETGETANLAVSDDEGVVFISQVETHQPIRAFFRPGTRGDYHSSGIGKAILAYMDDTKVEAIAARGLPKYTENTLSNMETLSADLREIRQRGWSIDNEERHLGMRCVAVPIFNEYSEPIGGISVSGPSVRVTQEQDSVFGPMVRDAAQEITDLSGGRWPE